MDVVESGTIMRRAVFSATEWMLGKKPPVLLHNAYAWYQVIVTGLLMYWKHLPVGKYVSPFVQLIGQ